MSVCGGAYALQATAMLEFSEKGVSPRMYDHQRMSLGSQPPAIRMRGHLIIEGGRRVSRPKREFVVLPVRPPSPGHVLCSIVAAIIVPGVPSQGVELLT